MLSCELRRPGRAGRRGAGGRRGRGGGGGAAHSWPLALAPHCAHCAHTQSPTVVSARRDRARVAHTGSTATHTPRVRDETLESHRGGNVYKHFFLVSTLARGGNSTPPWQRPQTYPRPHMAHVRLSAPNLATFYRRVTLAQLRGCGLGVVRAFRASGRRASHQQIDPLVDLGDPMR